MYSRRVIAISFVTVSVLAACASHSIAPGSLPQGPGLGQPANPAEIAAWDISIPPSGVGLPAGDGTVQRGESVYVTQCQACHGEKGAGKPADRLVGGISSLATAKPVRTVGSYWPYATTLFDYIRRAMPTTNPMSLRDDDVYAVTAYILYLNGVIGESAVINAQTLPQVKMPNRDGFIDWSHK